MIQMFFDLMLLLLIYNLASRIVNLEKKTQVYDVKDEEN